MIHQNNCAMHNYNQHLITSNMVNQSYIIILIFSKRQIMFARERKVPKKKQKIKKNQTIIRQHQGRNSVQQYRFREMERKSRHACTIFVLIARSAHPNRGNCSSLFNADISCYPKLPFALHHLRIDNTISIGPKSTYLQN